MRSIHPFYSAALLLTLGAATAQPASAQELITNGGFESGSLSSWQAVSQSGGSSSFYARPNKTQINPYQSTVGPATGSYYAVSDQTGDGSAALLQTFVVAPSPSSVVLSFDMFVDNYNFDGSVDTPNSLDYTVSPNQQARVDILSAGADVFNTGAGDLANYYNKGADAVTNQGIGNSHPYTHYTFDITSVVGSGGHYQLRFAEANNQDNLYQGIDNVSIQETASAAPEPSSLAAWAFAGLGLAGLVLKYRKRIKPA